MLATLAILLSAVLLSRSPTSSSQSVTTAQAQSDRAIRAIGAVHPRLSPSGEDVDFPTTEVFGGCPTVGGTMRRVTAGAGMAFEPCWSPDGKRLAFHRGSSRSVGELQVVDAETGRRKTLPRKMLATGKLYFSPDGRYIYGALRSESEPPALRRFDLQTGETKVLLPDHHKRQPWALSEDGHWVAYVKTMDVLDEQAGNDGPQAELWEIPTEEGKPQRITRSPARIHDLCWSADG